MGGGDKGLLALGGRPMLAHVIDRLRPRSARIAINANGDPARFAAFGLPVVADTIEGFVGPLAGVLAGMRWASASTPGARWIATVSADAPFLPARPRRAPRRRRRRHAATPSRSPSRAASCIP